MRALGHVDHLPGRQRHRADDLRCAQPPSRPQELLPVSVSVPSLLASFACGISTEDFCRKSCCFVHCRASSGGGLQPTQQAIILDHFPPEKRQQAFSLTAIAIIIAPVVGPVVGGYLTDTYSWHWIFLINIPIGIRNVLRRAAVCRGLAGDGAREEGPRRRFDYLGVFFIALALGCLEVGVDRGEDYDWLGSGFIRLMLHPVGLRLRLRHHLSAVCKATRS